MSKAQRKFECYDCKHEWEVPYGTGKPHQYPKCDSTNIHRHSADKGGRGANSGANSARREMKLCFRGTQKNEEIK